MKISRQKFPRLLPALLLSIFSLLQCSCVKPDGSQNANQNAAGNQTANASNLPPGVRDDVAELNAAVNFPIPPEEAVWREDNVSGKGKKLLAVLKYDGEDLSKVVAAAEKHNPAAAAAPVEIGAEEWFPDELTAPLQLTGTDKLKGSAYAANDFFNQPYANGRLIRINETNYFVLELSSF